MNIYNNIIDISEQYDTLFVDVYGVLFNGINLYEGVVETLLELKKSGKKIVILSNTTQLSSEAIIGYSERGIFEGIHYDYFITSGEFLHNTLLSNKVYFENILGHKLLTVKCLFMGNPSVFSNVGLVKTDDCTQADLIYVATPRASYGSVRVDCLRDENNNAVPISEYIDFDWSKLSDDKGRRGLTEFHLCLSELSSLGSTLLIANPDIFAMSGIDGGRYPIITQGSIGLYYEKKFGGKVIRFGKPYAEIFEFAKETTNSNSDKILMIGDTLWTDILGAHNAGIDSALVMTGVTSRVIPSMTEENNEEELKKLCLIGHKMTGKTNKFPTYLLRHFYK